jgi:8-oxo-dGTP diphosphatase
MDAAIAATPLDIPVLAGQRLVLRPLAAEDIGRITRLADDAHISAMTASIPHPYRRDHAEGWLVLVEREAAAGEAVTWAIADAADGSFIGGIALTLNPLRRTVGVIGYWLGREYWGRGLASEAAGLLLRHAFGTLGMDTVGAWARPDNTASLRVMEKLGMQPTDGMDLHRPDTCGPAVARRISRADFQAAQVVTRQLFVVAAALVDEEGRVLLAQRPPGKQWAGFWEFPGGKVAAGETPEAALIRELREELAIDVSASCLAPFTFASHGYEGFHLLMPLYVCRVWDGHPRAMEGQALAWVAPRDMGRYPMPPADRPLVAMLRDLL